MKKLVLTLLALVAFSMAASAQITQIKSTQLPNQARTTISRAWNNAPIVNAWRNKEGKHVEYKATVEDGSVIKFAANGQWIEVHSYSGVPNSLLPKALLTHLDKYYEGQYVVTATKTTRRYRVELSDGTKLEFNSKGAFQAFL